MKRKVVLHGPATLGISLPSGWAKKANLKKGSEVEVEETGNSLTISTKKIEQEPVRIELDATSPDFNRVYLCYCYRMGFDEVGIKFNNSNIFHKIKDKATTLIGYEIMEQKRDFFLIKNVSIPLSSEFDSFFRKLFLTTLEMG